MVITGDVTVDVTGVSLDETSISLTVGGTKTLTATVAPNDATDKTVRWQSTDASVATVSNTGVVTAVKAGTATIGAIATNGTDEENDDKIAVCTVTVNKADPTANAPTGLTATYGQTLADVTLTNPGGNTEGRWDWVDDTQSVGSVGEHTFKANFTPRYEPIYNSVSNVDVTVTVGKASYGNRFATGFAKAGASGTVDLSALLVEGYTSATVQPLPPFKSAAISGTTLSFELIDGALGMAQIMVMVKSANYADYSILVTLTVTDKNVPTVSANAITKTYDGSAVADGAITGTATFNSATVAGTWAFKAGQTLTAVADSGTKTVVFTPSDSTNYASAETTLTLTINKADVTGAPAYTAISASGKTLDDAGLGEGTLAPAGGTLAWNDPKTTEVTQGTAYGYTYTPTDSDNYNVKAGSITLWPAPASNPSSGGSSSSSGGSTPASTTVTAPVSGEGNTVNVSVTVSGDTATVRDTNIDSVLSESADTGTVTIDVSGVGREITEAVIPAAMVEKIADAAADEKNDADGLEVKLSTGTVAFDAAALEAITEQMTGRDLRLNLDGVGAGKLTGAQQTATRDMDVQAVYDAYMTSNGRRISDFKGGKATVTVPYALKTAQRAAGVTVWYVADNGGKTEMPASYDGKEVKFTVEHFSNYVIAYDAERAAACPRDATCPIGAFADADPAAWYHDGVHWALENSVMNGVGGGKFNPNGDTSRAMVATMLWRLAGSPVVNYAMNYADVAAEAWYAEAVRWATSAGVITGYGGKFAPDDAVTREQLAAMLWRYAKYKGVDVSVGEDTNLLSYGDAFDVSEYAVPAMRWAVGAGVVNGYAEGGAQVLAPQRASGRAVVATMLWRFMK